MGEGLSVPEENPFEQGGGISGHVSFDSTSGSVTDRKDDLRPKGISRIAFENPEVSGTFEKDGSGYPLNLGVGLAIEIARVSGRPGGTQDSGKGDPVSVSDILSISPDAEEYVSLNLRSYATKGFIFDLNLRPDAPVADVGFVRYDPPKSSLLFEMAPSTQVTLTYLDFTPKTNEPCRKDGKADKALHNNRPVGSEPECTGCDPDDPRVQPEDRAKGKVGSER